MTVFISHLAAVSLLYCFRPCTSGIDECFIYYTHIHVQQAPDITAKAIAKECISYYLIWRPRRHMLFLSVSILHFRILLPPPAPLYQPEALIINSPPLLPLQRESVLCTVCISYIAYIHTRVISASLLFFIFIVHIKSRSGSAANVAVCLQFFKFHSPWLGINSDTDYI